MNSEFFANSNQDNSSSDNEDNQISQDDELMQIAIEKGDIHFVEALLNKGYDVNAYVSSVDGNLLYLAAEHDQPEIAQLLLTRNAQVMDAENNDSALDHAQTARTAKVLLDHTPDLSKATDKQGQTALHTAAYYCHIEVVEYLLALGADPNAKDNEGNTAAHCVTQINDENMEDLKTVKTLINYGANIAIKNSVGETLKDCFAEVLHSEDFEMYASQLDSHIAKKNSPLHDVVSLTVADILLKRIPMEVKNNDGETPLLTLIQENNLEVVEYLLNQKADISATDNRGNTVLHFAGKLTARSTQDSLQMYKRLIDYGADINTTNKDGQTRLDVLKDRYKNSFMVDAMSVEQYQQALEQYIAEGNSPLHTVTNTEIARILLRRYSTETRNNQGETPLLTAIRHGNIETAEYLLSQKANVYATDNQGNTALYFAEKFTQGSLQMHKRLIDYGADIKAMNHYGKTMLNTAKDEYPQSYLYRIMSFEQYQQALESYIAEGNSLLHTASSPNISQSLLRSYSIETKNNRGETPLLTAIRFGNIEVAGYLLIQKADISVKDNQKNTVLHLTRTKRMLEVLLYNILSIHTPEISQDLVSMLLVERNNRGETPLLTAFQNCYRSGSIHNSLACVNYFLHMNVDVNAQDNQGNTLLHYIGQSKDLKGVTDAAELIKALIKKGADIELKNNEEKIAFDFFTETYPDKKAQFYKKNIKNYLNPDFALHTVSSARP